ncbi:hypothetical protein BDV06DRAFT_203907 [Aspergillus oleicola]
MEISRSFNSLHRPHHGLAWETCLFRTGVSRVVWDKRPQAAKDPADDSTQGSRMNKRCSFVGCWSPGSPGFDWVRLNQQRGLRGDPRNRRQGHSPGAAGGLPSRANRVRLLQLMEGINNGFTPPDGPGGRISGVAEPSAPACTTHSQTLNAAILG